MNEFHLIGNKWLRVNLKTLEREVFIKETNEPDRCVQIGTDRTPGTEGESGATGTETGNLAIYNPSRACYTEKRTG